MAQERKFLILYRFARGPNPWKVTGFLNELGISYETRYLTMKEAKQTPFLTINPNGLVPVIEDPNTGITLWDSGAILEYLAEIYDTHFQFSFPADTVEFYHVKQWLYFQMSGQSPSYGQAVWFLRHHPENLPSVQERYKNEMRRVTGVLEKYLEGRQYLVGDKLTYADIAFVPWQVGAMKIISDNIITTSEFPNVASWVGRITSRPHFERTFQYSTAALSYPESLDSMARDKIMYEK